MRRLRDRDPGYAAIVRVLWDASRPLAGAVALHVAASALLPILVLVAAGHVAGDVPGVARRGFHSPAGHRLTAALALTGVAYAAALVLGPLQTALGSAVKWRVVYRMQDRLVDAVGRPAGVMYAGASETLRRAWYLHRLASDPVVGKESRVFGIGGWLVDRYRRQWRLGMSGPWAALAKMDRAVVWLSVVVLAAFLGATAVLGVEADHRSIDLATLAVMLPMLAATTTWGDISWDDVALSWQVQGLPRAERLQRELSARAAQPGGGGDARGLPAREVRFDRVAFHYPGSARPVFDELELVLPAGASTALLDAHRLLGIEHRERATDRVICGAALELLGAPGPRGDAPVAVQ